MSWLEGLSLGFHRKDVEYPFPGPFWSLWYQEEKIYPFPGLFWSLWHQRKNISSPGAVLVTLAPEEESLDLDLQK